MAKNNEGNNGLIEKLAYISDDLSKIFPKSKSVVVFSLNNDDFGFCKNQISDFTDTNQFKIDISGIEFIFLKDELLNNVGDKIQENLVQSVYCISIFFGGRNNL